MTDPKTVLSRLRNLLANTSERLITKKYGDHDASRCCLPEGVSRGDVADALYDLDALITGTPRDCLATDREESIRQVCALGEQDCRELLVDLLSKPRVSP